MLAVMELKENHLADASYIQPGIERLESYLHRLGYPWASVSWRLLHEAGFPDYTLFIEIEPGDQRWLERVRIENNQVFSDRHLLESLQQRTPRRAWFHHWRGKPPPFSPDLVALDHGRLVNAYREKGYFDAVISPRIEAGHHPNSLVLVWQIEQEGSRYRIGGIGHAGQWPPGFDFEAFSPPPVGALFEAEFVRSYRDRLVYHLRNQGHPGADVQIATGRDAASKQVFLEFSTHTDRPARIGSIWVFGNVHTRDNVFLRELEVSPGDLFNQSALEAGLFRIQHFPMVVAAEMRYQFNTTGETVDIELEIREKKSGRFEGGLVYGEQEGAALQLQIRDDNFSLRPPWRGEAVQGSLAMTLGNRMIRTAVGLNVPRVWESPYSLDHSLVYQDNRFTNRNYKQKQFSAESIGVYPLRQGGIVGAGLGIMAYSLYDLSPELEARLTEGDDELFMTSLVMVWNRNSTDQRVRPTRGYRARTTARLGTRSLGGDEDILDISGQASTFWNPFGRHVLSATAGFQHLEPYGDSQRAPLPIRLYLGGTANLRGFAFRSVSPADADGNILGGETMWWTNLEYIYPLTQRFDLALYSGAGEVLAPGRSDGLETGIITQAGLGLLIRADNFPVRFDVAFPLDTPEWDEENQRGQARISFAAGYLF